eukprot:TRINITY_DN6692_c0_g1_i1.p3 TRINITY_DN6692_c0_g1~~TRINITY_DN6692_c0_g1_i1.p3  ORF type:complete len:136 (-),score=34.14 TRINITY_DN6692_c0_g1_i1:164-571(-)
MSYAAARQFRAHLSWVMEAGSPSLRCGRDGAVYEGGTVEVVMYTAKGCSLCDAAKVMLQSCRESVPHTLRLVDIRGAGNEALFSKYKYDIPVIFVGDAYFAKHRLDRGATVEALRQAADGTFVAREGEPDSSALD